MEMRWGLWLRGYAPYSYWEGWHGPCPQHHLITQNMDSEITSSSDSWQNPRHRLSELRVTRQCCMYIMCHSIPLKKDRRQYNRHVLIILFLWITPYTSGHHVPHDESTDRALREPEKTTDRQTDTGRNRDADTQTHTKLQPTVIDNFSPKPQKVSFVYHHGHPLLSWLGISHTGSRHSSHRHSPSHCHTSD